MTGPLLAWIQKLAVQHFRLEGLDIKWEHNTTTLIQNPCHLKSLNHKEQTLWLSPIPGKTKQQNEIATNRSMKYLATSEKIKNTPIKIWITFSPYWTHQFIFCTKEEFSCRSNTRISKLTRMLMRIKCTKTKFVRFKIQLTKPSIDTKQIN